MPLTAGTRLGHYEIQELLGAGGMGEVYKARDPRLNRTVAIKVLHGVVSHTEEARARFEREAQTIANLSHPNICVAYDLGRHEQTDYLVMELLDGETLSAKLERGPLPIAQALKHAIETADALDKAHRLGVTHRDLKPANIMLTRNGAKLMDFGLAKLRQSPLSGLSNARTQAEVTAQGAILGTVQYMAPEQLEGGEADSRSDLFSLGAVLYEMVTGRKAFEGKSAVSVMSAILKDTPKPLSTVQPIAPAALERIVETCLEKDPEDRWQSAHDLGRELRWIAESAAKAPEAESAQTRATPSRTLPWSWIAALVVIAILASGAAVWLLKPAGSSTSNSGIADLVITLGAGEVFGSGPPFAVSPDGRFVAYVSQQPGKPQQIYLRPIDSPEAKAVSGSDGATYPFFSADGQWIAFQAQGKLKKASLSGGAIETICDMGVSRGGSWGADNTIFFAPGNTSGIWSVPAAGGMPKERTTLDRTRGEVSHRFPQVLPGGKAILLLAWTGPGFGESDLQVLHLDTGKRETVVKGARMGQYVSTGHLVYSRADSANRLFAVPFDLDSLEVSNSPPQAFPESPDDVGEAGEFALSDSGTLVYRAYRENQPELVWVDRDGKRELAGTPPSAVQEVALSPDGRQIAVNLLGPVHSLSIYDIARATWTPLAAPGSSQTPRWTADGKRLFYRGTRLGFRNLYWRAADGSGSEEKLTEGPDIQTPVTTDGKVLLFVAANPSTAQDIWQLSLDGDRTSRALLNSPAIESSPDLSSDGQGGHWLAYVSNESGRNEVWVRPFPALDKKWKISTDGGFEPKWSLDGKELFYRNGDKLMAVQVTTGNTFSASTPHKLFEGRFQRSGTSATAYSVSADAKRFLMIPLPEDSRNSSELHVVLNWMSRIKR